MILTGIDLETTGIDHSKGERIIEISMLKVDSKDWLGLWKHYDARCNPRRHIQPGATAVHHITDDMLEGEPYFEDIADDILKFIEGTDILVAHNMDFDGPFLASELDRISKDVEGSPKLFCTMQNRRWATASGKLPNLGELCFACGISYDSEEAHAASYDTDRMMQCLKEGLAQGWYVL